MDVVVVGGGIVGTTLAAALARDGGTSVTLCERGQLGEGTTTTSAAVFTTQQPQPTEYDHRLRQRSWGAYEPLVRDGSLSYEQVGHLTVAESESYARTLRDAVEPLCEFGYDAEWVDAGRLPEFDVASEPYRGALQTTSEGYFDVDELVAEFASQAREDGASIRSGTAVTDIHTDESGAVTAVDTRHGRMHADAVVNAAGPWAREVDEMVGVASPLRHTVGPILVVDGDGHDVPFTIFESKRYVRPTGDGGAYVGKYLTDYANGEVLDPDAPTAVLENFRTNARTFLDATIPPLADATVVDEWVGLRTVTPDGRPIVGESSVPGFYHAVGMSGLGVTLAPAVADLLAAAIRGERPDPELLEPLDPGRF